MLPSGGGSRRGVVHAQVARGVQNGHIGRVIFPHHLLHIGGVVVIHSARGLEEVLILEEPRLSLPLQSGRLRLLLPLPGGGVPVMLVTHWVTGGVSGGGDSRRETPGGGQPAPSGVAGVAWCPAHAV